MPANNLHKHDVCVIGSGFGGAMAALPLVHAGYDVVMVERGSWVPRGPHNWAPEGTLDLTPYYSRDSAYRVLAGGNAPTMAATHCVGGPSVFYGGVSLRYRAEDFGPQPDLLGDADPGWPFGYETLAPYYDRAEALLDIAGDDSDPTAPPRAVPYPQAPAPLSGIAAAIAQAGRDLGLTPFRLPLAINYRQNARACQRCATCDTFACAVSAKNDVATAVIGPLLERGMTLRADTVAVRLCAEGDRVVALDCMDRLSGEVSSIRAKWFVVAAGALASPHLLLASGLDAANPARQFVGARLLRHVNGIVFGVFPQLPGPASEFHKQIGFHDLYFGDREGRGPRGKLGNIQQVHTPPLALVKHFAPSMTHPVAVPLARRMTGLLVMAEDQPDPRNRVTVDAGTRDRFGLPQLSIEHRYSKRDLAARQVLARQARRVLVRAGARLFYHHKIATFSHALGTLRMGHVAARDPVDPEGRFRGLRNVSVTCASALPTAAAVNPSLTIAAHALRVGELIAQRELRP